MRHQRGEFETDQWAAARDQRVTGAAPRLAAGPSRPIRATRRPVTRVRSLFVSDLHLGCVHAHVDEFLAFLNRYHPERLYIVGDFIDWWKLRRSLKWEQAFNDILARMYELAQHGTELYYTPGNHDAFLRQFSWNFPFVTIADELTITLADGRRFLVTHGDRFDRVECAAKWVSMVASVGYDGLLATNRWVSRWRRQPSRGQYAFSSQVKRTVKQFVRYISDFEERLAERARMLGCAGVICGHIHTPEQRQIGDVLYCNTGDWVENCTAFVEDIQGGLELIHPLEENGFVEPSVIGVPRGEPVPTVEPWQPEPLWHSPREYLPVAGP